LATRDLPAASCAGNENYRLADLSPYGLKPLSVLSLSAPSSNLKFFQGRLRLFAIASTILLAAFSITLVNLVGYCLREDLFSYILLVPFVTGFMIASCRKDLEMTYSPATGLVAGLGALAGVFLVLSFFTGGAEINAMALRTLAFISGWNAISVWALGGRFMRGLAFPAAFLVFLTPLPPEWVELIEHGLQHASAEVSAWLFSVVDIPFFRTGLTFQLPNLTLEVAPECSGIRSSLVLFITSLVAGKLLLDRPWQRVALTLLVIPLGIFRNAFRIVTLGWLCTHHGAEMIHSPIHHRGGPVFFAISLLPLLAMLVIFRIIGKRNALRKMEN
jgi:exosortase C (VPDSG-CTERM-specific)